MLSIGKTFDEIFWNVFIEYSTDRYQNWIFKLTSTRTLSRDWWTMMNLIDSDRNCTLSERIINWICGFHSVLQFSRKRFEISIFYQQTSLTIWPFDDWSWCWVRNSSYEILKNDSNSDNQTKSVISANPLGISSRFLRQPFILHICLWPSPSQSPHCPSLNQSSVG